MARFNSNMHKRIARVFNLLEKLGFAHESCTRATAHASYASCLRPMRAKPEATGGVLAKPAHTLIPDATFKVVVHVRRQNLLQSHLRADGLST